MGRYAGGGIKRPLSKIAIIDNNTIEMIASKMDMTNYILKETGKGLSSNDYTDEDKAKVEEGIGGTGNSYFPNGW